MNTFGASAPLEALQQRFGFTSGNIVSAARALVRPEVEPMETRVNR